MMNDGNSHAEGPLCTLRELESRHIARALELAGGNQRRAARVLGITRWALARRLRKLGLHSRPVATAPRNDRDNATPRPLTASVATGETRPHEDTPGHATRRCARRRAPPSARTERT